MKKKHETPIIDDHSLELLASAISGKAVRVVSGKMNALSWTDGQSVFIDQALNDRQQLETLIFQSSLLASGSLAADVMRKLKRNSALTERFLVVEGNRALLENEALLPDSMHTHIDRALAARSDSPTHSLEISRGQLTLAKPPQVFGCIQPHRILAAFPSDTERLSVQSQAHTPRRQHKELKELEADDADNGDDDNDSSTAVDAISVGGASGIFGRWLQRLLKAVRRGQGRDGGPPGTDAPTHQSRRFTQRRGPSVMSTAVTAFVDDAVSNGSGLKYPEWDMRQNCYREDWCTVHEVPVRIRDNIQPLLPDFNDLRRPLARIGLGLDRFGRQLQGEDIDIDAAIESRVEAIAGSTPEENIYVNSQRRRRDLSVLILLDVSGSAGESSGDNQTIHQHQCRTAASLTAALHNLGDRVALYAFNSRGRSEVQLIPIKRFDGHYNAASLQRLYSLKPGGFSRLGAAIRHGASVLESTGGTSRRLLLVLSDGLAYDHGYEKVYGAADARRALAEVNRGGTANLCLTFGLNADAESLRNIFGSTAHATLTKYSELGKIIGPLIRTALRSAEVKRRIA
ncbi:VWA domain-containing protein [Ketobacter sp. MCCC 1A13808]|uniref:nitric oxide reductase activation protein NorD n=1 Tax=Ketobacter sp. MCCC 1A13808 TaxID=2602738 RepID=UPI0012EBAF7F|nr:VWA domain-containing protein [Ketobacter sp. MCCC 1A13808]MVF11440.1 VWA domain-containing protein [Ketobacter sp. MCCC 1A13808]